MKHNIIFFDLECVFDELHKQDLDKMIEKYGEDKLGFLPELNKILTISVWYVADNWEYVLKWLEWSEAEQIKEFFKLAEKYNLCWFNIQNFDLPFIIKRALWLWIKIPYALKWYWKKPREITNIIDLQEVYKMNVWWAIWNLDLTCKHLWITSPKEEWISWADVQQLHNEWQDDMIVEYCTRDVKSCIQLYEKFLELNII